MHDVHYIMIDSECTIQQQFIKFTKDLLPYKIYLNIGQQWIGLLETFNYVEVREKETMPKKKKKMEREKHN